MTDNVIDTSWGDDPLWYRDAIIYHVHVKAFYDANDDGIGDFAGLMQKLDYIQSLGVNTIWLLPFYPSPMRDDGYDIANYRQVASEYGTLRDFRAFVREAHRRDLKIITELVINHTSDQHPWFQAARRAPRGSAKRDYYIWSDTDERFADTRIIFSDTERSNWTWDPVAGQYYWHRFFAHQPDLNHNNPQVVKAVTRVMRFWLDMGVDGLRLDAIPYLCVREGTSNENLPETHAVIRQMRAEVDRRYRNRMFIAEANQWPEDVCQYFGDGDECHMAFHFPLMPRMYMAVAQEDRHPINEILSQTPEIPGTCQWAIFLRNHDELTLEMVTDRERDYMYAHFANDPRMRINVGIRRRLAPLMDNDIDKIKLMNSLLLSMPGSPIIYYGDEIGMGDNIFLGDRNGVRTPMQWNPDRNAGFSRADPQRLYLPVIMDSVFGYGATNVEAQSREPASLLNWMRRLLSIRKSLRAFGRGTLELLRPGNRKILAYVREHENESVLCVANLAASPQPVELDLARFRGRVPVELTGRTPFPPIGDLPYLLTLPGHGFYWFRLATDVDVPGWHAEALPARPDLPVLVLTEGLWSSRPTEPGSMPLTARERASLESQILPGFLESRRWFAAKGMEIGSLAIEKLAAWPGESRPGNAWFLAWVRIDPVGGEPQRYLLPLGLRWGEGEEEDLRELLPAALARVRHRADVGLLYDATVDTRFSSALIEAIGRPHDVPFTDGRLCFRPTGAYPAIVTRDLSEPQVRTPAVAGSNTVTIFDDRIFLKVYRRLREGVNPEVEIGRFLTDVSPFPGVASVAGAVEYEEDGRKTAIAVLQQYVPSQGDMWAYTRDYLARYFNSVRYQPRDQEFETCHSQYLGLIEVLGRRTAELHVALAARTGEPAFEPEPVTMNEARGWQEKVLQDAGNTLQRLRDIEGAGRSVQLQTLLSVWDRLMDEIQHTLPERLDTMKTRYHGDLHLGQALVVENDFVFIDFEGEPGRPAGESRAKHSPLRDVAGMLRSFSYAAWVAIDQFRSESVRESADTLVRGRAWERSSVNSFLVAYWAAAADCAGLPRSQEERNRLLRLFTIEKALYELRYELDNRPDWVDVPVCGLLDVLDASPAGEDLPSSADESAGS